MKQIDNIPVSPDVFHLATPEKRQYLVVEDGNLPVSPAKPLSTKTQAQKKDALTLIAESMSEAELQDNIVDMAQRFGWMVHGERPARTKDGQWRTPVQGDAGWPDLVLARYTKAKGFQLLIIELKSEKGTITAEQMEWLRVLEGAKVWRPLDWLDGTIEEKLR